MTPTFIELVTTQDLSASGPALTGMMPPGEASGTQAPGQGDVPEDFISQLSRMMAGGATEADQSTGAEETQDQEQSAAVLDGVQEDVALEDVVQEPVTAGGAEVLIAGQDGEGSDPKSEDALTDADGKWADPGFFPHASVPVQPEMPSLALGHGTLNENDPESTVEKEAAKGSGASKSAALALSNTDGQAAVGGPKTAEPVPESSSAQRGAADSSTPTEAKPDAGKIDTVFAQASEAAETQTGLADETAKSSGFDGETVSIKEMSQRPGTQGRSNEKGAQGDPSPFFEDQNASAGGENASAFSMDAVEEEGLIKPEMVAQRTATPQTHGAQNPVEATTGDGADPASGVGSHQTAEKSAPESVSVRQASTPRPMTGDVVNQIADRAVFLQRNGQSEVRMDLKPEYLGRVQMKVATENHRVTVHLLAETPMAREIIEANLGQLRSDLANQGLNVDQIEVAMFASADQDSRGAGTPNQGSGSRLPRGTVKMGAVEGTQTTSSGETEQVAGTGDRSVDYFA